MKRFISVVLATALTVALAPNAMANSRDGESSSPPSYEVDGGVTGQFRDEGPKRQTKTTKCRTNCTPGGVSRTPIPDYQFSKTLWFDDTNDYYSQGPDGGRFGFNFDSLHILSKTSIPKADRNFGYTGNAIPAPGTGSFVIKDTLTVNGTKYVETQPVFEQVIDPITGVIEQQEVEGNEWEWLDFEYRVTVSTMQAPALQNRRCVSFGEYQLNGPYSKDGSPMKPVTEGGTMTRQPIAGGPVSHLGQKVEIPSALGQTMTQPKNGTPNLDAVWANCLPNQDARFEQQRKDSIGDLGRYEAPTTLWGAPVEWLYISGSEADIAHVFPALVSAAKAQNKYRYVGGIAYVILQVNPVSRMAPFASYYKVICANGTQASKRSEFVTVSAKSYDGWDAQPWDDAGVDYYSWDCTAGRSLAPNEINTDSFLQCDRYGGQYAGVVENKPAAPLLGSSILIDGEPVALENIDGVYQVPATADPVRFEWERIRINTQDGTNILNSPNIKNTVWEFSYQLDPASSPMLKNTDVNDEFQPYHGWVDSTAEDISAAEMPLDRQWEPGKHYQYDVIPYSYSFKSYTYSTVADYKPYTYRSETYASGTYSYACGTYTYQSGSESYQCGGGYSYVSSGGATYYWWANGGRGGYACPGGWWLSGSTCYTNTYVPPQYCSRPTYGTGTNYCTGTSYSTRQVKNSPPSGYFDNGSQYQRNTQVKNPPPAGYSDNGTQYQKTNPAPTGYTDDGTAYISNGVVNRTGQFGGIEFNDFREWPSRSDDPLLGSCTVNPADYGINGGEAVKIRCGDNVTDRSRAAYFRYFQSSNAGSGGWKVTPWVKVTADIMTTHSQVTGTRLNTDGTLSTVSESTTNWVREPFACPAQPVTVNIERVVG